MNLTETTRIRSMVLALTMPLVLMLFAADAECAQASQKSSDELLLEIMDLHSELVINETFLAQAKMLGAYLEAAQPLEESKKIKIYAKVLNILSKIKDSETQIKEKPKSGDEEKSTEKEKPKSKTVYEPGAALLEIFKLDTQNISEIPDLPVIGAYWRRDLAYSGGFLLPDRISEIGENSPYFAKFSFYFEAKESGKYGFTLIHSQDNGCQLKIGGVEVVTAPPRGTSAQGVCNLKKGFHRFEFQMGARTARASMYGIYSRNANFQVKVLTPDTFDSVPLTKDMMLLKKE